MRRQLTLAMQTSGFELAENGRRDPRLAKLGQADKSQHMFAKFERLHRAEQQDAGAVDQEQNDDARKATEAP